MSIFGLDCCLNPSPTSDLDTSDLSDSSPPRRSTRLEERKCKRKAVSSAFLEPDFTPRKAQKTPTRKSPRLAQLNRQKMIDIGYKIDNFKDFKDTANRLRPKLGNPLSKIDHDALLSLNDCLRDHGIWNKFKLTTTAKFQQSIYFLPKDYEFNDIISRLESKQQYFKDLL